MLSYCLKCGEMCEESTLWGICPVGKFVWGFALWGFALWGFALWGFVLWGIGRETKIFMMDNFSPSFLGSDFCWIGTHPT